MKKAVDPFTGEEFTPRTDRHYEANDGKPVAPPVTSPRLSLRERVERLLAGGQQLHPGIYDDDDPTDWSDDDGEPLTAAETAYIRQGEALEARTQALQGPKPPASPSTAAPATPPSDPPSDGPSAPAKPGKPDASPA